MSRERSHGFGHGCVTARASVHTKAIGCRAVDWSDTPARDIRSLMPTIVVDVMPKAELLDPQGKAVSGALSRLGVTDFSAVRIGKRFELTVDGEVGEDVLAKARRIADDILSNSVIEDVVGIEVVE